MTFLEPAVILSLLFLAALYSQVIKPLYFSPLSHIPGPRLCKVSRCYLSIFELLYTRNSQIHTWHKRYGPIICIRPREISFSSPVYMRDIYGCSGRYDKSAYFDQFIAYGERAVFSTLSYPEHQQKRRMLSRFFQATNIKQPIILNFVRERTFSFMQTLDSSRGASEEALDVFSIVNRFAFDNITRLLYGPSHGTYTLERDEEARELLVDLRKMQFLGPLGSNFPFLYNAISTTVSDFWPQKAGGFIAGKHLQKWTDTKILSLLQDTKIAEPSLWHQLESARDSSDMALSKEFIACELLDNVHAAEATVTVALSYFIWHLSRECEWQRRIQEELRALPVLEDGLPSVADIEGAVLLEAFLNEVYRVNPGSSGRAERVVPAGGKFFGDTWIPEGAVVSASTIALHHDPLIFHEPTEFRPERWLSSAPDQLRQMQGSFIPFGYGARVCTGKVFATLQIKTLIAALYIQYSTRIGNETDERSMWQTSTQDAWPWGLKCEVVFQKD